MKQFKTGTIGYPRIGPQREMKWALEKFWQKKISAEELISISEVVAEKSIFEQINEEIDFIGVGSHTLYDHVLDWAVRFGFIPDRFKKLPNFDKLSKLELYFIMARGNDQASALDMTKWFDTNYHNLTPEISSSNIENPETDFSDYLKLINQAIKLIGKEHVSAEILGPLTFAHKSSFESIEITAVVKGLKKCYNELINSLDSLGITTIQIHEPALVLDQYHSQTYQTLIEEFFYDLSPKNIHLNLVTYFDDLGEAFPWIVNLKSFSSVSLDFTRGDNLSLLKKYGFPADKILGAGLFDARSVWNDYELASQLLSDILKIVPNKNHIQIQPSSSLMFLPHDLELETNVESNLVSRLCFAKQKLKNLKKLAYINTHLISPIVKPASSLHFDEPSQHMFSRSQNSKQRRPHQLKDYLDTPLITSTIGSFPQTSSMRSIRFKYRKGLVPEAEYQNAVDQYIAFCIGVQEGVGLDILVHGEPERSDMVEYFAEKMTGFLFTDNGWVQSYGNRYVRPPIIYEDIRRKNNQPMTTREYKEASKHTTKPVKGMLTGPITIINWSFPRNDISRKQQSFQIALALRDEIVDLEKCGCQVIQVDEPALREGLPLKSYRQEEYLNIAVNSFRLATAVAQPFTHIVTHFCYSEFGEILESIKKLDADQITMENSRSDNAMLKVLASAGFENMIAPGVYDVHSPSIPTVASLKERLKSFLNSNIPKENLMVVPDCGLKTRNWKEVIPSLRNLVKAVYELRSEVFSRIDN